MDVASTASPNPTTATFTGQISSPRLQQVVRIFYLTIVVISLTFFVLNLIVVYQYSGQLPATTQAALQAWGLSSELYFGIYFVCSVIIYLPFFIIGVLIYWRRPHERIAVLAAIVLLAFGSANLPAASLYSLGYIPLDTLPNQLGAIITLIIAPVGWVLLTPFLMLFPDGRFVPAWSRIIAAFGFIISLFWGFFPQAFAAPQGIMAVLAVLIATIVFGGSLYAQLYRYRQVSSPIQRQQTKWFVAGLAIVALITFLSNIPYVIFPEITLPGANILIIEVLALMWTIGLIMIPLSIGFAILRYRLWDVDLLVNRSLVYGLATAGLIVVFGASVFLLQSLLGSSNTLAALVISAIGPVALFNPVKKQVQGFIDRRLYHLRFDLNEMAQAQRLPEIKQPGALTGRKFGGYEVLDVIGHGGMGEVYKGFGDGRVVALKVMVGDLAKDPDHLKRFAREASTLTALQHPHIVQYYGSGIENDQPYLAMEFVDGIELSASLRQQRLSVEETITVLKGIAAALDYAHEHGFVHRDIKPANIMLRTSTDPVLMDFGIAKIQDAMTAITATGAIGTIDYMAPEQIMQAREVDHRADIYALGVVAYEMLAGERPFKGSAGQVLFAHLQQPPPDLGELRPDLSRMLAKAVEKALAKQAEDRFQSAGEFVAALI